MWRYPTPLFLSLLMLSETIVEPTSCQGGTAVTVGAKAPAARRVPIDRIDHSIWNSLLGKYVNEKGLVDYSRWKDSATDRQALDQYLQQLSTVSTRQKSRREAKLAFWINAYNAVTVKGILREYPTSSIRNHTPILFGYNIWKDLHLLIENQAYSLEQIEHEILRKMDEPRIHFAIVCASMGCPRFLNEAYAAETLNEQLADNTKAFFADRTKFRYDTSRRSLEVSPILEWFAEDFGSDQSSQMRYIAPYLPDAKARFLAQSGTVDVRYLDYDWGLNDQSAPSK